MECMVTTVLLSVSEGFLLLISCTTAIRSFFSVGLFLSTVLTLSKNFEKEIKLK